MIGRARYGWQLQHLLSEGRSSALVSTYHAALFAFTEVLEFHSLLRRILDYQLHTWCIEPDNGVDNMPIID